MKIITYILEAIYNLTGIVLYRTRRFKIRIRAYTQKHFTRIGLFCVLLFFTIIYISSLVLFFKNIPWNTWTIMLFIAILLAGIWFILFLLKFLIQETSPQYRSYLKSPGKIPFQNKFKKLERDLDMPVKEKKIVKSRTPIRTRLQFDDLFTRSAQRDAVISSLQEKGILDPEGHWISRCLGSGDATAICILIWKLKTLQFIKIPGKLTQRELCELSAAFFSFEYDFTMISKVFRDLNEKDIVDKSNYAPILKKLSFLDDIAIYNR